MAIASQETALFVKADSKVATIGCPTNISGGGSTNESIETTSLGDSERTYIAGLSTPSEVSFEVRFDPRDASHMTLKDLQASGDKVPWAIGFSDGDVVPKHEDGWDFTSANGDTIARSYIAFEGFVTSLEFDFSMNDVVTASVGIQTSGQPTIEAKA